MKEQSRIDGILSDLLAFAGVMPPYEFELEKRLIYEALLEEIGVNSRDESYFVKKIKAFFGQEEK